MDGESWDSTRQLHHLVAEGSDLPTQLSARPAAQYGDVTSVSSGQQKVTLGRGAQCDVVISDDRVSRLHAIVRIDGASAWIEDAESTNGTYVDGEQISGRVALREGAAIRFGRRGPVFRYGHALPSSALSAADGGVHYSPSSYAPGDEDSGPRRPPDFGG